MPRTSSENRTSFPIGFLSADVIAANDLQIVPNAGLYEFGILSSQMHMAWIKVTSGRLKSDFRYSAKLTYNTFPWPTAVGACLARDSDRSRANHPHSTLATLYHPNTMPDDLRAARQALDQAVDAAYLPDGGQKKWKTDSQRVAFLFRRYEALTSLLAGR